MPLGPFSLPDHPRPCPFSQAVSGKFAIQGAGHGYKQLVGCMGLASTTGVAPDWVACRRGLEEPLCKTFPGRRAEEKGSHWKHHCRRLLEQIAENALLVLQGKITPSF